jgi:hypothetical protein
MPRYGLAGLFVARWNMFKFTIREITLLTVIVAMGLGWWSDRNLLIYRYDDYIRKTYNFKHMHTPGLSQLFEPASNNPRHWRFHTKEDFEPFR